VLLAGDARAIGGPSATRVEAIAREARTGKRTQRDHQRQTLHGTLDTVAVRSVLFHGFVRYGLSTTRTGFAFTTPPPYPETDPAQ
jgi:hypothetical protein